MTIKFGENSTEHFSSKDFLLSTGCGAHFHKIFNDGNSQFFFKDKTCLLFITTILCGGVVSLELWFFLPVLFIAFV